MVFFLPHFIKQVYLLFGSELHENIDTTLVFVTCTVQQELHSYFFQNPARQILY